MSKTKKKISFAYIIPALLLVGGAIFLFMRINGDSGGFFSGGYKSYGYFQGGEMSEDLDVRSVRWHQHKGYERVVFDVSKYDGVFGSAPYKDTGEVGIYQIGIEVKNGLSIDGELSGYRAFSARAPSFKKSKLINKMEIFPNDIQSFLFSLELKKPASYKVFTLKNPTRIIIDIR